MARATHSSSMPPSSSLQYGSFAPHSKGSVSHAKIHRRGNSGGGGGGSSYHSPPLAEEPFPPFKPSRVHTRAQDDMWSSEYRPAANVPLAPNNSKKIKPYLRKFSTKDSSGSLAIDLSLPASENPSLSGLGIDSLSAPDVPFAPANRARHTRSTSNNSQFSTNSGFQRPTPPYAHPMRQTPRPYTPPVSKSYSTSVIESDHSEEADDIMSPEEFNIRQHQFDSNRRSGSLSSLPNAPPPLHIHTSSSLTRLANPSQTSLPGFTTTRSRGDTMNTVKSFETTSPSSRTSMDKAMSFIRGDREPLDAASRAASITAARQAFREKEEAKERKAEKDELKQIERKIRQSEKKDSHQRRKMQDEAKRRARAQSNDEKSSTQSVGGTEYGKIAPTQSLHLPVTVATVRPVSRSRREEERNKLGAKSRWMGFVAWLRTKLLKLGRKMRFTT